MINVEFYVMYWAMGAGCGDDIFVEISNFNGTGPLSTLLFTIVSNTTIMGIVDG